MNACEKLKRFRELMLPVDPTSDDGPHNSRALVVDRPRVESDEAPQNFKLDAAAFCECMKVFTQIVQAQTRPATGRGLTNIVTQFHQLLGGVVEQILPADPMRRLIVIGHNPSTSIYSPTPVNLDLGVGIPFPAGKADPITITEETHGAFVQSAWFGFCAAAQVAPTLVLTESYLGTVGEKQLWQPASSGPPIELANQLELPLFNYSDQATIVDPSSSAPTATTSLSAPTATFPLPTDSESQTDKTPLSFARATSEPN